MELRKFKERFRLEGPGSVDEDLDAGEKQLTYVPIAFNFDKFYWKYCCKTANINI